MRRVRLGLGAAGLAAMSYAIAGTVVDAGDNLAGHAVFLLAVLVGHDLVLLPVATGVGWLLVRTVPGWARAAVQSGLFASAVVTAIAIPFVLGYGRTPDNPSRLPLDYGRGLLLVLAAIWLAVALGLGVARLRAHRRGGQGRT